MFCKKITVGYESGLVTGGRPVRFFPVRAATRFCPVRHQVEISNFSPYPGPGPTPPIRLPSIFYL